MPDSGSANEVGIFDVRRLVASLNGEHRSLEKAARRWIETHSCSADLKICSDYLADALRWHSTGRVSLTRAKTALVHSAVLSYARCFDPRTKHRSELPIVGKFDEMQRKFHGELIDLRHEALAHFGPAGLGSPWHEDSCYIIANDISWQPMVASRRAQFQPKFALDFYNHIQCVALLVDTVIERWRTQFQTLFQQAWENDATFGDLIQSTRVDPLSLGGWEGPILGGKRDGRLLIELSDKLFVA